MFCDQCGGPLSQGVRFCAACGAGVDAAAPIKEIAASHPKQAPDVSANQPIKTRRVSQNLILVFVVLALTSVALAGLLVLGIFNFGVKEKYPDVYGIFVWSNGQWTPVGESRTKIDLDLPADTRFLIHQKSVEKYMQTFELAKKIYVRNIVQRDPDQPPREVKPYKKWDKQQQYLVVKGQFGPVKGQAEMVVWAPSAPLAAGVYEPIVDGKEKFAFSVRWKEVSADLEGSVHCVDIIKTNWGGIPMGARDKYVPCSEADNAKKIPAALNELSALCAKSGTRLPDPGRLVLRRLVESGVNPNIRVCSYSILSVAASSNFVDVMELLLSKGADINGKGDDGTPLHWAIAGGMHAAALFLINKGADVNLPKSGGWRPLDATREMDDRDPQTKVVIAALMQKGAKGK